MGTDKLYGKKGQKKREENGAGIEIKKKRGGKAWEIKK